ncbi:MAG: NAD(P)H-binding protein [Deltaproteobacteria bacterium]|nr:NAD(P)H-binding protein [Deltaproteobacteria bacterium]
MKALVIGASGGFGGAVAREMLRRGVEVTALVRQGGRDPKIAGLWQAQGDALDSLAVSRAARGMDVIVHGFNVPYQQWVPVALKALDHVIAAAIQEGATILFPGNVYGLGPDFSRPLSETCPRQAPEELGKVRNSMERRLRQASEEGVRVIVLRAGDFFGPQAANTWFEEVVKRAPKGGALMDLAPQGVPHAWAYLPDVARAAVDLLERREALAPYEEVHFEGYALTSEELMADLQLALGDARKVRRFPWWALRATAPFWPMGRYLLQMRYLWQKPVLLDGGKLRRLLGSWRNTPLGDALRTTLANA